MSYDEHLISMAGGDGETRMSADALVTGTLATTTSLGHNFKIDPPLPSSLVIQNDDGSDFLRLGSDGTATGPLVDKYPDAIPAMQELGKRIVLIMSRDPWSRI